MKRPQRSATHKHGFSIIELSVVLGCVSILMTLAIPELQRATNRAHAVEAITTANTIERQLVDYYNRYNSYPANSGQANPMSSPGNPYPVSAGYQPWLEGQPGWTDISFSSGGQNYLYRYQFTSTLDPTTGTYDQCTIYAYTQFITDVAEDEFFIYLDSGYRIGDVEVGE